MTGQLTQLLAARREAGNPLRVGLIGAGIMGTDHVRVLCQDVQPVDFRVSPHVRTLSQLKL